MVDTVYRTFPFELAELKAADAGWQFSGYASTFGNVDQGGDVVMRGAFDATLKSDRKRRLFWQHDSHEPIGVELALKTDDRGLFGTWKLADTTRGTDAHKLLKIGAVDSMSIGYVPVDVEFDDTGTRLLKSVDLLECSVVSLPMNERAVVTQVKAKTETLDEALARLLRLDEDEPFQDVLAQVKGFFVVARDTAEALATRRAGEGRNLSAGHRQAIDDLVAEAKASTARLERLLADPGDLAEAYVGDLKFRLELARRLRERRARGIA